MRDRRARRDRARSRRETFCTAPGRNVLQRGEILATIVFPPPAPRSGSAYERFIPRNEMDIAVVGAASWVRLDADRDNASRRPASAWRPSRRRRVFAAEASQLARGQARHRRDLRPGGRAGQEGRLARSATCGAPPSFACTWWASSPGERWRRRSSGREGDRRRSLRTETTWGPLSRRTRGILAVSKKIHVTTTVNGEPVEFLCEPRQSLLEVLRDTLRLTGAKEGCNNGNCGACTVILDGVPVNSCLVLAVEGEGSRRSRPSRVWPSTVICIRSSSASWKGLPCSAGSARRVSWSPPRRCWTGTPIPASTTSASTWPTTSAAARATTRSCRAVQAAARELQLQKT